MCPNTVNEYHKYEILGENRNIVNKIGIKENMVTLSSGDNPSWVCVITNIILDINIEIKWKIKIIKT